MSPKLTESWNRAKITLEDAVQHLYHFCALLPADRYVDPRPLFTFSEDNVGDTRASVTLPNSVDPTVREARSASSWASQKMAKRDAAYEAYLGLYRASLLSDHLLPLRVNDSTVADAQKTVQKIASLIEVQEQLSIWPEVAGEWQPSTRMHASTISVILNGEMQLQMLLLFPRDLPGEIYLTSYWSSSAVFSITIEPSPGGVSHTYLGASAVTTLLLQSVFKLRMENGRNDYAAVFVPIATQDLQAWGQRFQGSESGETLLNNSPLRKEIGIIRDLEHNGTPHIFDGIEYLRSRTANDQLDGATSSCDATDDEPKPYLRVKKLPKRADFLHPIPPQNSQGPFTGFRYLLPSECEVDSLPFVYTQFALFIPSILHVVEVNMLAEHFCNHVLQTVQFNELSLVITAISASVAQESTNYQRLEFLGDSILKYFTSLTLLTSHLNWHEGYLSHQKDHIVSNANLARSALSAGLDRYILTKPFTGHKWRPIYISSLLAPQSPKTRQMSTKTLADVVESLIGAAYLDGGFPKALACIQVLLPSTNWTPIANLNCTLYETYDTSSSQALPGPYLPLQSLLGHTFALPALLLEALTHPSDLTTTCISYQRLEFLGDALLDRIITITAFCHTPSIPTHNLHLIRTALVNANFLAFLCMDFCTKVARNEIIATNDKKTEFSAIETEKSVPLWAFMRHSSPAVSTAQIATQARFTALHAPILAALTTGTKYPWTLLARLDAPKFYSDIIESVLGAVYIDTKGSWEACEAFLDRLGVGRYLERVLKGEVARVMHPKEELGIVAVERAVRYEVFRLGKEGNEEGAAKNAASEEGADGGEKGRLGCRVWVGEREIVCVGDGISRVEVETRAAEEAVEILQLEREGE